MSFLRRLSVRFNRRSRDTLEQEASLVLDTLVEMGYTPSEAVKLSLQYYGVNANILPNDGSIDTLHISDEERIARRVAQLLSNSNIVLQNQQPQKGETFLPTSFDAFD